MTGIPYNDRLYSPDRDDGWSGGHADEISVPMDFSDLLLTVVEDDTGRAVFGPQVDAVVRTCVPRALPSGHEFFFVEIQTAEKKLKDYQVVGAAHPYSLGWVGEGRLRGHNNRGAAIWKLEEGATLSLADALELLDGLSRDPYCANSRWLTARVYDPRRDHPEAWLGRQAARKFVSDPSGGAIAGLSYLCFAICDDVGAKVKCVMADEIVLRALSATDQFLLFRYFKKRESKLGFKVASLLDETLLSEADDLMNASIRRALAGPVRNPAHWVGKPVANLAVQIYLSAMYDWNRRLHRGRSSAIEKAAAAPVVDIAPIDGDFEDRVNEIRARLNVEVMNLDLIVSGALKELKSDDVEALNKACAMVCVLAEEEDLGDSERQEIIGAVQALDGDSGALQHAKARALASLRRPGS